MLIPVYLVIFHRHHRNAANACRSQEATFLAEATRLSSDKVALEAGSKNLDGILADLNTAHQICSDAERRAQDTKEELKALTDEYGVMTDNVGHVLRAMSLVRGKIDPDAWHVSRLAALQSLHAMVESLHASNHLRDTNHDLLERFRRSVLDHGGSSVELEW